ncbi:HTH_48 domain-containing protein [Trichonephila inaurata madagascariensis]|uniref:HTH_48 domain-containing protein n=1 Tax=Trichonephila inaurata madagascariensis TaxID=2747483 RepID=A0A8X6IPI4_9ARAC|nr:HTH_48 domain-containing protein [Trichonephila inaurata madagascariensis]
MERRYVLNSWSKEEVRAVTRYEWARGVSGTEIHNRLVEVYGPGVMSTQMVRRWCRTFSGRHTESWTDAHGHYRCKYQEGG